MKSLPILLAVTLFADPVAASDPRIVTRGYDASTVAQVNGRVGIQSTIEFSSDEHIENVAVGNSATWQVTPNKHANLLFVKPVAAMARTNMTVITDKRTYLFDLRANAKASPVYVLRFLYSKGVSASASLMATAQATSPAAPAIPAPVAPDRLNFAWKSEGAKNLLPSRVFDDGRSTWLQWPKNAPLPAMLSVGSNGEEGPMNYAVRGEYVVLDNVPQQILLRRGKAIARLLPAPTNASDSLAKSAKIERSKEPTGGQIASVAGARP
jgi:type IV secretion system protein VirB9